MTTPTELLRQAREALAYLLPLAEMQPADVEPGRHLMRGDSPGAYPAEPGMTLRDYAAIKAMAGMLSGHFSYYGHENYWCRDDIATAAYEIADAMLRARAAKAADGGE